MSGDHIGRWGRYELPDPVTGENRSWTRATTLAGVLDSQWELNKWKMRNVLLGVVSRPDLLDVAYASDPGDKKQLDELVENALKAANTDLRSNQGTALHKFTARLDAGDRSRSPRQWDGHLREYESLKEKFGIETHPSMIERITVVPELGAAGTIDRIVKHEGELKIADLKTGRSLAYGGMKMSIQLAIYSRGEVLWHEGMGKWVTMPAVSRTEGLIMHLPADFDENSEPARPELYRIDLELGWIRAQAAKTAYDGQKDKNILRKVEAR
ncbi:MAG TPA: PD-(D/E)XK nuclease family protein [Geobacteraceae bacterium]|nr:PD-(D/E)XK nuclease family protein [Geobacteraceae bacterium]